jgi:predicted nucleic acid-binding protein
VPDSTTIQDWKPVVKDKWLLLDTDALISILAFNQENIFEELISLNVQLLYIHPVLLELMNTVDAKEKLRRTKLLYDYDFTELPLNDREMKLSTQIQKSLPLKCQPSPTDLYLGSIIATHNQKDRLLLTANIKDFPMPVYTREGHVLLQNNTNLKLLTILCLDKATLVD